MKIAGACVNAARKDLVRIMYRPMAAPTSLLYTRLKSAYLRKNCEAKRRSWRTFMKQNTLNGLWVMIAYRVAKNVKTSAVPSFPSIPIGDQLMEQLFGYGNVTQDDP